MPDVLDILITWTPYLAVGFGCIAFNWPGAFGGFGSFVFFDHAEGFHFNLIIAVLSIVLAVAAFAPESDV